MILTWVMSHQLKWILSYKTMSQFKLFITLFQKLLFAELKYYIENLYNIGWIINFSSSYSVVAIINSETKKKS